jgi:O-antigen/teichoic acid export membrane protein
MYIFKKILFSFGIKATSSFIGLITTMLLTRNLEKSIVGNVFLFFSVVAILTAISKLGLESQIVKKTSNFYNNERSLNKYISNQIVVTLISSFVVGGFTALIFLAGTSISFIQLSDNSVIFFIIPAIILETIFACSSRIIQGMNMPYNFLIIIASQKLFLLIFMSICFLNQMYSEIYLYGIILISYAPSLFILFLQIKKHTNYFIIEELLKNPRSSAELKDVAREGIPLLLIGIFSILAQHFAVIYIGYTGSSQEAAEYGVCLRIVSVIGFLLIATNSVAAPHLAKTHLNQGIKSTYDVYGEYTCKVSILCIPLILSIILFGKFILGCFGSEYIDLYVALIIMSIGQIFNLATGTISSLYIMTEKASYYRNISILCNLFGISILPALMSIYPKSGAAISYALTMTISNLTLHLFFKYKLLNEKY